MKSVGDWDTRRTAFVWLLSFKALISSGYKLLLELGGRRYCRRYLNYGTEERQVKRWEAEG